MKKKVMTNILFIEENKRRKKKKYIKKNENSQLSIITNKMFDSWQTELSQKIHEGYNILLDIATSCGKTWAVRTITTETILSEDSTCLFITPNIEILFENYQSLLKSYKKTYYYNSNRIASIQTLTKNNASFNNLTCQILFITADNIIQILANHNYLGFIKKLKFIIFDEVHIDNMQQAFTKSLILDINPQFILLSATLNNPELLFNKLSKITTKRKFHKIKYHIRPIPIQKIFIDKSIEVSTNGARSIGNKKSLLKLIPSLMDPTLYDLSVINNFKEDKLKIPEFKSRESHYLFGKELISNLTDNDNNKILEFKQNIMDNCCTNFNTENLLATLQHLISNNKGPIIIFNPSSIECIKIAKDLLGLLQYYESNDKELKKTLIKIEKLKKQSKRNRDKPDEIRHVHSQADIDKNTPIEIPESPDKWRFKSSNPKLIGRKIPEWIYSCLEYGIAIHSKSIKGYIRTQMFDLFNDKQLEIIISDKSLSAGVNLPVKTVILTGDIDPVNATHMAGRAGRRGLDSEAYVISLMENKNNQAIDNMILNSNDIDINIRLSLLDIIQLNSNRKIFDKIIGSYTSNITEEDKNNTTNYINWIDNNLYAQSSYANIPVVMESKKLLFVIKLLFNNKFEKPLNDDILIILANIFIDQNEFISYHYNTDLNLYIHDYLNKQILEFNSDIPDPTMKIILNDNISYLIMSFLKKSVVNNTNKDLIGNFQRKLFTLAKLIADLPKDNNFIVEHIKLLDEQLWIKCKTSNIKV